MTDGPLPPAVTGVEMRLDAVLAALRRIADLLTPAAVESEPETDIVELREPERRPAAKRVQR